MMLTMNGREAETDSMLDPFMFRLAEALSMPLDEVRAMPYADFVQWRSYFTVKNAMGLT